MAFTLKWTPNVVLDMALAQVTTGMNRAAKFAADDAKRRARGARIKGSIRSKSWTDGRTVHGAVYTTWFVTRIHEMGSTKMAARPMMRPAVLENGAEIARLIGGKG